jgi:hypothetical protein
LETLCMRKMGMRFIRLMERNIRYGAEEATFVEA